MKTFPEFLDEARKKKIKIDYQKPIGWKIEDIGPGRKVSNVQTGTGSPLKK